MSVSASRRCSPLSGSQGPVLDPIASVRHTLTIEPGKTVLKTYRLEGNLVRRILPPGTEAPGESHPDPIEKKEKKAAKARPAARKRR